MTGIAFTLFLIATASSLVGLASLYLAWKTRQRPGLILIGWACLTASAILFTFANGDRGLAQGGVILMSLACLLILAPLLKGVDGMHAYVRKARSETSEEAPLTAMQVLQNIWTFLVSGPIAGIAALLASAAMFRLLKPETGNPATVGVSAIILAILLWALFSVLMLMEARPIRRTIYAAGLCTVSALGAFL